MLIATVLTGPAAAALILIMLRDAFETIPVPRPRSELACGMRSALAVTRPRR